MQILLPKEKELSPQSGSLTNVKTHKQFIQSGHALQNIFEAMTRQFHFCFRLLKLSLLEDRPFNPSPQSTYKLLLLESFPSSKNNLLTIGESGSISPLTQSITVRNLGQQQIRCIFRSKTQQLQHQLEIRLVEILQQGEERTVGGYQFNIINYIHISDSYNRHAIELNVQMGQIFALYYEVFLDRCREGLELIIQQHRLSKVLVSSQEDEQELPEQGDDLQGRRKLKELRIDEGESIIMDQTFWSPTNLELHHVRKDSRKRFFPKGTSLIREDSSRSSIKLQHGDSTFDEDNQWQQPLSQAANNDAKQLTYLQVLSNRDSLDQQEVMDEMYQFIRQHSKIMLPPLLPPQLPTQKQPQPKSIHTRILKDKLPITRNFIIWFFVGVVVMFLLLQSYQNTTAAYMNRKWKKAV